MAPTEEDSKERTTVPKQRNEKAKILRLQVARLSNRSGKVQAKPFAVRAKQTKGKIKKRRGGGKERKIKRERAKRKPPNL